MKIITLFQILIFLVNTSFGYSQSELLLKQLQKDFSNFPLIFNQDSILNLLPENWTLEDSSLTYPIRSREKSTGQIAIFNKFEWINISRRYYSQGDEIVIIKFCGTNRNARRDFRKVSRSYKKHFAKVKFKKRTIGGWGGFWTEKRFYLNRKDKVPYMAITWCPAFDMVSPTMKINIYKNFDLDWTKKIERNPKF